MTHGEFDKFTQEADRRMKMNNGHSFQHILKTRCIYCGKSPKVKTKCGGWFMTFIDILRMEMCSESESK